MKMILSFQSILGFLFAAGCVAQQSSVTSVPLNIKLKPANVALTVPDGIDCVSQDSATPIVFEPFDDSKTLPPRFEWILQPDPLDGTVTIESVHCPGKVLDVGSCGEGLVFLYERNIVNAHGFSTAVRNQKWLYDTVESPFELEDVTYGFLSGSCFKFMQALDPVIVGNQGRILFEHSAFSLDLVARDVNTGAP